MRVGIEGDHHTGMTESLAGHVRVDAGVKITSDNVLVLVSFGFWRVGTSSNGRRSRLVSWNLTASFSVNTLRTWFGRISRRANGWRFSRRLKSSRMAGIAGGDQAPNSALGRDDAANAAGFGGHETARLAREVVEDGILELVQAVDSGEVSVSAAAEVTEPPPPMQRDIVAAGPKGSGTVLFGTANILNA